mgnify:CR=1 FL=1
MAKRSTLVLLVLSLVSIYAFHGGGSCVTQDGDLAAMAMVTCSSCHGSSIGVDIVVGGGKFDVVGGSLVGDLALADDVDGPVRLVIQDAFGAGDRLELTDLGVDLDQPVLWDATSGAHQTQFAYDGLLDGPVELTVEAVIGDGDGTPNGDRVVSQTLRIEPDFARHLHVTPDASGLNVSYLADHDESVDIEVHDLLGRRIAARSVRANAGVNAVRLDVPELESDRIYFASVRRGGETLTSKFMVRR